MIGREPRIIQSISISVPTWEVAILIDEIIALLSTDQGSITDALLKTKILLHQIGQRELTAWVNEELNGYGSEAKLPPYRVLHAHVLGNVSNLRFRATSHPIPIGHLPDNVREGLENIPVTDSLAVVQQLASGESLRRPLPLETNPRLARGFAQGTHVEQAWCEVSSVDMKNIIFQVRSRLLDFMLDLKNSLGPLSSENDVKRGAEAIDAPSLFQRAIFGSHATIIVGNSNKQHVGSVIIQGDFNSLAMNLKRLGVNEAAIKELTEIANNETNKSDRSLLRNRVGNWIREQAEKQLDSGAQAAISISIDAVTHAVRAFFGF